MFQPTRRSIEIMDALDCEYLITHRGAEIQCEIRDKPTGKIYVNHIIPIGRPETELVEEALEKAMKADKPLTAAQALHVNNSALADENARLKAQLAALQGGAQLEPPPVPPATGRRRKPEPTTPE